MPSARLSTCRVQDHMLQLKAFVAIGLLVCALLAFSIGVAVGAVYSGDDFNAILMPFLSMTGSWASGIGALVAVVAAVQIATAQMREARLQGSVRCAHYAITLVDDLINRVDYQRKMLTEGGRPIAALLVNADAINRRYEGLFMQEQYLYLPGPAIDIMKRLAGSFFGLKVMTEYLQSSLTALPRTVLPANLDSAKGLCTQLDGLLTELQAFKDKLNEFRLSLPTHWYL